MGLASTKLALFLLALISLAFMNYNLGFGKTSSKADSTCGLNFSEMSVQIEHKIFKF